MADREALARLAKIRKLLDAVSVASVAIPSPAGDVVGVASDLARMGVDPRERTLSNLGLAAAGLIPGVPSPSAARALGPTSPMGEAIGRTINFDDQMALAETVRKHRSGIPMVDAANAAAAAKRPPMLDSIFDADRGVGAVPNNLDVNKMGRVEYMRPSEYLNMAEELRRPSETSLSHLRKTLDEGGKFGQPTLQIDLVDGVPTVVNHDGRHRAMTIKEKFGDDVLMPVHLIGTNVARQAAKDVPITKMKSQRDYLWDEKRKDFNQALERAEAFLQAHKDKSRR